METHLNDANAANGPACVLQLDPVAANGIKQINTKSKPQGHKSQTAPTPKPGNEFGDSESSLQLQNFKGDCVFVTLHFLLGTFIPFAAFVGGDTPQRR